MPTDENLEKTDDTWKGWEPCSGEDAFMAKVGPIWQRLVDDTWEYGFESTDARSNRNGAMHGGMIATFADYALGHTAWLATGGQSIATIHLGINFVSAARIGKLVLCKPEVVRKTRSVCFMRGAIIVDDLYVATADGIWKIVAA